MSGPLSASRPRSTAALLIESFIATLVILAVAAVLYVYLLPPLAASALQLGGQLAVPPR